MFGFVKDQFIYIKCPKNGCMTYTTLLAKHGWKEINLFDTDLDLSAYTLWGHITNPYNRHTKGVDQYLRLNPDININNDNIGKMLVSGVFDEHTYSLNMMLGHIWNLPIHWIPLDAKITKWNQYPIEPIVLTGDDLTNEFFKEYNIDIVVTANDRRNVNHNQLNHRKKIESLKNQYPENFTKLVKNFLEPDIILYKEIVDKFNKKYSLE